MDWGLGSFVFEAAFGKLATALRWMFWGMLLQVFGAGAAGAPVAAIMLGVRWVSPKLVLPGIIAMLAGGIVLIIGEQKCSHLEVPLGMTRSLPGHHWLRAAYWCHLGSWLMRMARRLFDRRLVGIVLLPMQLLGFTFLLLFLRKTAEVLVRRDLKRLVDTIFVLAGATLLTFGILAAEAFFELGIMKGMARGTGLALVVLPVILFLAATACYVILLGRMAAAADDFAKYLGRAEIRPAIEEEAAGD